MADSMIGRTLGRFQVLDKLGQGGMGMVYKAMQSSLNRTVAIKVLPAQLAMDHEFVERFRQEAQVIANLQHESIVHVYDIDEERLPSGESLYFIVMEYVDGETLRAVAARHRILPPEQVRTIGIALARALDYAHGRGIVHRDIKTANVMITRAGQVKLMDFGIAKSAGGAVRTMTGSVLGTPEYMAPEQARSGKVTPQSDLYSLGVLLFEIAAGRMPFVADDPFAIAIKHLTAPPPHARELVPTLPLWLDQVIYRLMAKEPAVRYASAADLASDLRYEVFTPSELAPVMPPAFGEAVESAPTLASPSGAAFGPRPTPASGMPGGPATWPPPPPPTPPPFTPPPGTYAAAPTPAVPAWSASATAGGPTTPMPRSAPPSDGPPQPSASGWTPAPQPSASGWTPPPPISRQAPATAFDVPKPPSSRLWVPALLGFALVLGVAGGAWWIRRDPVTVKVPAVGENAAPAAHPGTPKPSSTSLPRVETEPAPGVVEQPVERPEPPPATSDPYRPSEKTKPPVTRPATPPAAQPTASTDAYGYRPAQEPAPVPAPAPPVAAPAPSPAELWQEAAAHKDKDEFHSLRRTLDQLLAVQPQHSQAREWRRKADGWIESREDDLREEVEDLLDSLGSVASDADPSDLADLWGGVIDGGTADYFAALWQQHGKVKMTYQLRSVEFWDHRADFAAQLTFADRDKRNVRQLVWRGALADDDRGLRFVQPLP